MVKFSPEEVAEVVRSVAADLGCDVSVDSARGRVVMWRDDGQFCVIDPHEMLDGGRSPFVVVNYVIAKAIEIGAMHATAG